MSATGRKPGVRRPQDEYDTPKEAIESLFDGWYLPGSSASQHGRKPYLEWIFLEPCAGSGNILKEVFRRTAYGRYVAIEKREACREKLEILPSVDVTIEDFFKIAPKLKDRIDLIITNPPYVLKEYGKKIDGARKFLTACLACLKPKRQMAFLLRLNYLGSQKRKEFHRSMPLKHLLVLSKRPSFTGKGTDATEYAWFVYEKGFEGDWTGKWL